MFLSGDLGREPIPLPVQHLEATHIPFIIAPSLLLQSQRQQSVESFLHLIALTSPSDSLVYF